MFSLNFMDFKLTKKKKLNKVKGRPEICTWGGGGGGDSVVVNKLK
jgi:hypothetical protein